MNPVTTAVLLAAAMLVIGLKARIGYLRLPKLPIVPGEWLPDVTVIVPARNEASTIGRLIKSLPGAAVVVVDDASTDDTAEVARKSGAVVVTAPPLPEGIVGKPHACQFGALTAPTRWLLFVDADTWYAPHFVSSLVAYAEYEQLEMVSVFLRQETTSQVGRALMPYASALYFAGLNTVNANSPFSREALANGQCLLIEQEAYHALGGHASVSDSVVEDIALARLAKDKDILCRVVRSEDGGAARACNGMVAIYSAFERTAFRFVRSNPLSGMISVVASITFATYVPLLLGLMTTQGWPEILGFVLVPGVALLPWYRSASAIWKAPLAVYLFLAMAVAASFRMLAGARPNWKGRVVG